MTVVHGLRCDRTPAATIGSTPGAATGSSATVVDEEAPRKKPKRRRAPKNTDEEVEEGLGGFALATLKAGARGFCRLGTPFSSIYQLVRVGMMWDLERDARLRSQPSLLLLGSTPTDEEIKAIQDIG